MDVEEDGFEAGVFEEEAVEGGAVVEEDLVGVWSLVGGLGGGLCGLLLLRLLRLFGWWWVVFFVDFVTCDGAAGGGL